MAKITLIRPPTAVPKWAHTTPTCPPIGLVYVAASLEAAGHQVQIIDAVGEAVFQMQPVPARPSILSHGLTFEQIIERIEPGTEFFGVSCMFSHEWPLTKSLIRMIREHYPNRPILGGGEHITAVPEESLRTCAELDYCVLGEGEEGMVDLVEAIANGRDVKKVTGIALRQDGGTARTAQRARIRAIDEIPQPRWDLVPLSNYLDNGFGFGVTRGRSMPIIATRGCPYQRTFCSNPQMWTTTWLARDPASVVAEMKEYIAKYQAENFDFYDLTAIVKKDWIICFGTMLLDEGLKITWQLPSGTRSEAIDEEVAKMLYASGCRNLSYVPESGSPAVLKRIKKKVQLDRMELSMRQSIRSGLNIKANIILGFPGETHREVWQTFRFLARMAVLGVQDMSISPFSPYPGSELFDDLTKAGKITKMDDEYYWNLASYTDITKSVSYSQHVSNRWLSFYRITGMLMFYVLCYLARPLRFFRTIRNLITKQHESRLEMSLHDLMVRLFRKA